MWSDQVLNDILTFVLKINRQSVAPFLIFYCYELWVCVHLPFIDVIKPSVWPEATSFSDEEMGPIPAKWKGICQNEADPG